MVCKISYIEQASIPNNEKERLNSLHSDIFLKAKQSGNFRQFEGKLYTLKNGYSKAVSFVNSINGEYGDVAKINTKSPGQHYLSVNVLNLATKQGEIFSQEENTPSKSNSKTLSMVRDFVKRIGVDIEKVKEINVNGVKQDANGIANIAQNLIQVVEGKEDIALSEEAMHFAVEIIEQKNPQLFNKLLGEINDYNILKQVFTDYGSNPFYQNPDKTINVRKIKKEAIAKVLVETIINKSEGFTEKPELLAKTQTWWAKIVEFLKNLFTKSGFDEASMKIIKGEDIGNTNEINKKQEQYFQEEIKKWTSDEIKDQLKPKDKPNERKFNRPTNLPEDFRILQRTGFNKYSPLLSSKKNQLGNPREVSGGESSESIPYYEGIFGRTFKELLSSPEGGAILEGRKKRYSNLRVIQSISETPLFRQLVDRLRLEEIRIIDRSSGRSEPLFVDKGILHINEDVWLNNLEQLFKKGVNLDEYIDLAIFEEFIHLIVTRLYNSTQLQKAGEELESTDKLFIDKFYNDKNPQQSFNSPYNPYQTINEVVRMKVQKDLIDKSTETLANENFIDNLINKVWDFILDLFKNKLPKANNISENTKKFILEGGKLSDFGDDNTVLGLPPLNNQNKLYDSIKDFDSKIVKKDESYEVNGKKISKRVTDFVKEWGRLKFGERTNEYDKIVDDLKATTGTKGHLDIEHAFKNLVDENGYVRAVPVIDDNYISQIDPSNNDIYDTLYKNLKERLNSFPKGTRFMSEVKVYDAKRDIAGTIDFLALTPEGKVNILDWKFMDLNTNKYEDIPWYKIEAWRQQMGQYKLILEKVYNIKSQDFEQTRMIPIRAIYLEGDRKKNTLPRLKSVQIGDVTVKNIKEDYLLPVSLQEESSKSEEIDSLLEKLNALYTKISEKKALPSEKARKSEQLNTLFKAIRQLQMKQNIQPLLFQIKTFNKQVNNIIEKYNTSWDKSDPSNVSDEEINNFSDELLTAETALDFYTNIDTDLSFLFQGELTEEDKKLRSDLRDAADIARYGAKKLNDIGNKFADKFIAGKEKVDNLLTPEKVIKGLPRLFSSTSNLQIKALQVLYKKANRILAYSAMDTNEELKKLQEIKKNYDNWAKGLDKKKYFDIIKKKGKHELIDEFNPEFYSTLKEKIAEKDYKWMQENIDIPIFKQAIIKKIAEEIVRIEAKADRIGTEEEIDIIKNIEKTKMREKYNISSTTSLGWLQIDILKQAPNKEKWESKEWKELSKPENRPAKDFYNYIIERNKLYHEIGYLNGKSARVFLPFIRKSLMERIVTGDNWKLGEQFLRAISVDEGDSGYGQIDPLTGRIIDKIPTYFTREIEGDLSEDLFRNMAYYNEMALRYKYLDTIESQVQTLIRTERNKKAIATSMFGKTVYKDGKLQYSPDNEQNSRLVEDTVKAIVYGQKYIQSEAFDQLLGRMGNFGERVNKKLGFKLLPENLEERQLSINKSIDVLNNTFQLNALGLNPLSALSNLLGGTFQSIINAETYFTKTDFEGTALWLMANKMRGGEDQKKMVAALEYFLPLTENYNAYIAKTLSVKSLSAEGVQDFLMVLMRNSDWAVQTTNFYTMLKNSIVEDGKVINVREYLRKQPEFEDMYAGSQEDRKARKEKFESEVKRLLDEKGVIKLSKLDGDRFVIPNVDRKSDSVIELRRKVQSLNKDALGNLSEDDVRNINRNIMGKSFMLFKNWIPRLVDVRTGNLKYNSASDAYEWGRLRNVFRIMSDDAIHSLQNLIHIGRADDKGIKLLKDLYEKKREEYKQDTGKSDEEFKLTQSQFNDLVIKNVKSQATDAIFMLTLVGLFLAIKNAAPDDDEDEHVKNGHKFMVKAIDKIKDELFYFYNPLSFTSLVSGGIFPSLSYINNFIKLLRDFGKEMYGLGFDEEIAEKAHPLKYLMKTFPITNQALGILPIFYPEMSKTLGLKMQTESKPIIQ